MCWLIGNSISSRVLLCCIGFCCKWFVAAELRHEVTNPHFDNSIVDVCSRMNLCAQGWTGESCNEFSLCSVLNCKNGGNCVWNESKVALTKCECPQGYYGVRCEQNRTTREENFFQRRTVYHVTFHDKMFKEYENGFGDLNDQIGVTFGWVSKR